MARGRHKAPKTKKQWALRGLIAVLSLCLITAGLGYGAYLYIKHDIESRITTEDALTDYRRPAPKPEAHNALNLLVLGSDTREGDNGVIAGETPGLSDTAILLHISQNRKFSYGVSIPRDSMVERPECPRKDGGGTAPAEFAMFNTAYAIGGAPCTMKTLEVLTGVPINHFLVIDFSGFKELIDKIGGVEICVPEEVDDPIGNIHLKAGTYNMDGKTALDYVRVRHGIGAETGDIGRMKRQQSFISAVLSKLLAQDVLGDPVKTYDLAQAVADSLTTDKAFADINEMIKLANSLRGLKPENIDFFTVPFELWPVDNNRVIWDEEKSDLIWQSMIDDKRLTKKMLKDSIAPKSPSSPSATAKPEKTEEDSSAGLC